MRLLVYSHDAFGLGNIRRMLAICQHLLSTIPEVSILVLSGSPAIHNFKIPARLDYIKLPCLGRDRNGKLAAKYLTTDVGETVRLRSHLIKTAVLNFRPDLVLVDKKPYGLLGEFKPALDFLKNRSPRTKLVLLLRDILDSPQKTIEEWHQEGYYQAVQHYYDRLLVVGTSRVFNLVKEYQFPPIVAEKTTFCGYIKKEFVPVPVSVLRQKLGVKKSEKLIVVTPGGGEDGYSLIKNYLAAISLNNLNKQSHNYRTLIIFGSEMSSTDRDKLSRIIKRYPKVITLDFTAHLMNYLHAADLVISMAGYNTITEILSLGKKALVIPRYKPSREQLIRALRMDKLGLLTTISPHKLTVSSLERAIEQQLNKSDTNSYSLNFDGLLNIQQEITRLLSETNRQTEISCDLNFSLVHNRDRLNFYPIAI